MSECTNCRAELPHQHGGLCRHCYADGQIGYYIPVWMGTPSPAPSPAPVEVCAVCRRREATIIDVQSGQPMCRRCWGMGEEGYAVAATPPVPLAPLEGLYIHVGGKLLTGAIAADMLAERDGRAALVDLLAQMTSAEIVHLIILIILYQRSRLMQIEAVA